MSETTKPPHQRSKGRGHAFYIRISESWGEELEVMQLCRAQIVQQFYAICVLDMEDFFFY